MTVEAPAWTGDWLNGWLAAIGAAACSGALLHFTSDPLPVPVLSRPDGLRVDDIADALPGIEALESCSIARTLPGAPGEFPRNPTLEQYRERAAIARTSGDRSLGATVTDQFNGSRGELPHSPFDAAVPKGITVAERVVTCRRNISDPVADVHRSVLGTLPRVKINGLGFDARRIAVSTASDSDKYVDPVVETFAFTALPLFSVRGDGVSLANTRGWATAQSRRHSFTWPAWSMPLSVAAIDALLDLFWRGRPGTDLTGDITAWRRSAARLGVTAAYGSIAYRPTGSSDTTRGYSSERIW